MAAIKDLGIKEIYYTTNDGFGYEHLGNIEEGSDTVWHVNTV
jgi:hypothetical protein